MSELDSLRIQARLRRERFLERLADLGAAALVLTAPRRLRNGDSEHRFRPESDFWYLTAFGEPEAALLLRPGETGARSVLFLREKNREEELWSGRRLGVEAAPSTLGVDQAYPWGELWTRLPELLRGSSRLVYQTGLERERDSRVLGVLDELRRRARGTQPVPSALLDPGPSLHEMRLRKDEVELRCMRRAAEVSARAHRAAMRAARPGMGEHEIEALLEHEFRRAGGSGPAYTTIVAGGPNATVLHYVENDRRLRAGELLLIDAGTEWLHYASDVTRTFPVSGRFTTQQRELYLCVLAAQRRVLAAVRPGATLPELHELAVGCLCEGLARLGLVRESPAETLEKGGYRRFYMHRTSHFLGLDVHDVGLHAPEGRPRPLEPGMVLTVEPGLYVAPDDEEVDEAWRGLGVRIEDDVLVTPEGSEVLTEMLPTAIDEIEAACGELADAART